MPKTSKQAKIIEHLKNLQKQIIDLQHQCQELRKKITVALKNISKKVDDKKIERLRKEIDAM